VHGLVGVYSPSRATYTLQANNPFILYPFGTEGSSVAVQGGQSMAMPGLRVEIGGMKAVSVDGNVQALQISHNLVLRIDDSSAMLRGSVTNASPYTLRGAMLVTPGDWTRLGDLPPGGSAKVSASLTAPNSGPQFYDLDPFSILNVIPYGTQNSPEQNRELAMLQALLNSRSQGNWGIYLMGWLDQAMVPVSIQGESSGALDTSLYVDQLNPSIQYGAGTLRLTPGLLAWESSVDGPSPYSKNSYGQNNYVLRFHPAFPVAYNSVQQLSLYLDAQGSASPSQVIASLWDFGNGQWEKVDNLAWGSNDIAEPGRYVGAGGEVRLQIEGSSNSYLGLGASTITLVVNR